MKNRQADSSSRDDDDQAELSHEKAALSESEARYRAMLEAIPDLMFLQSRDGVYLDFHAKDPNRLLVPPEQFMGKNMRDVLPPELAERFAKCFDEVVQSGQAGLVEYAIPILGEERHYEARVINCDRDKLLCVLSDITERKRTEAVSIKRVALRADVNAALAEPEASLQSNLQQCAEAVAKHLDAALARIWTLNHKERVLELQASAGLYTHLNGRHSRITVGEFKIGKIAEERKPHLTNDVCNDPRVSDPQWARDQNMAAFAGYPLLVEDRVVGVIAMFTRHTLTEDTMEALATIAAPIAQGIERKRAEQALRESEERFRSAFDHAAIGMALVSLDLRALEVNQSLCELLGYSEQELVGKDLQPITHPDDLDPCLAQVHRCLAGETRSFQIEKRYIHKRGHLVWVLMSASLLRTSQGQPLYFIMQAQDITEWKQAEQRLRESENRFRALADSAPVPIWVNGADAGCEFVNKAYLDFFGKTLEEAQGFAWQPHMHPDDSEQGIAAYLTAFKARAPYRTQARFLNAKGEYRWLDSVGLPRFSAAGEFLGYAGASPDITELKRAEFNTQFINQLGFALSQIADANEIIRLTTSRLGEYLAATSCYVIEINSAAGLAIVRESWNGSRQDAPRIAGEYRIDDYVTPEFIDELRAGKAVIVRDLVTDPRTRDFASNYESFGIAAFISMPALNEKQWEATLTLNDAQARDWRPDEIQLMRDTAARLWAAVKRARALEALRESEERFRQLAENIGAVFFITEGFSGTSLGRIVYVSPAYERVWGRSCESVYQNTRSWFDAIHAEDRKRIVDTMRSGQTHFDEEFRVVHPSGEVRWVHDRVFPIRNERGETYRHAGIVEDITERKRAEEALRKSEDRARRTLVEQMLAGVAECDAAGKFVLVNQRYCDILGYTEAELLQMSVKDITHPDDLPRIAELYGRLIESGESFVVEKRYCRSDGIAVWVNSNVSPIRNARGEVVESVAVVIDVTDRKQAEREREQLLRQEKAAHADAQAANRSKDEFLAVVSHELRSPLTSILGYARLLRKGTTDVREIQRVVEIIERNGKIQLRLIEDLLDTARIISGKLKLEVQPLELANLVAGTLDVMRPAAQAKGIELRSRLEPLPGLITGDPNRLQQIVWNLLSNAIKFTSPSGRVELLMEKLPQQVRITVNDTGKGIEPEFLPFVFDRFRQSDSSSARRFGGLGLGLSLVKQLVELHGGTIEAASDGPGRGASFMVTLPQHATQTETDSSEQVRAVAARKSKLELAMIYDQIPTLAGVRVLVVDDEEEALSLLAATLGEYGAQVKTASSGAAALAILAAHPAVTRFDVLILDINMPDEDGYLTLQKVRMLEARHGVAPTARVPAIALTALGRTEDRLKTLGAGFRMHVVKPVEPTELIVVIASVLERRNIARRV